MIPKRFYNFLFLIYPHLSFPDSRQACTASYNARASSALTKVKVHMKMSILFNPDEIDEFPLHKQSISSCPFLHQSQYLNFPIQNNSFPNQIKNKSRVEWVKLIILIKGHLLVSWVFISINEMTFLLSKCLCFFNLNTWEREEEGEKEN